MEKKNIYYIPGRGISKAVFAPINPSPRPEMPKTITMSGTFTLKGNPNKLKAMLKPRVVKCWQIEASVLAFGNIHPVREIIARYRSYQRAVKEARQVKKEMDRFPLISRSRVKVKKCRIKIGSYVDAQNPYIPIR